MRYATLALATLLLAPLPAMAAADPPVKVKISNDKLFPGERAKVYVKTAADGYLLVLRVDTRGNIRILFPIDPSDDAAIRGGHKFEVRARGDREAFTANENRGTGFVMAVRSDQPFTLADFTTGHHWNSAALRVDRNTNDPQAALLGMVDQMTDGHYDYDVANYAVGAGGYGPGYVPVYAGWYGPWYPGPYAWGYPYYYGPRFGFGINIGSRGFRHGRH
jgi:hypothetical protein